ncbi:MAG: hypothetical protein OQK24_02225 [Magnetovibrio sp.]|nr:hypothetical protein [Magnetovibrio sp.]
MKKILLTSLCVCTALIVGGCQTSSRGLLQNRAFQESNLDGIQLGYNKYGSVTLRVNKGIHSNSGWLKRKLKRTFAGSSSKSIMSKDPGTIIALPYPRTDTFPVGTVLSKPKTKGFSYVHDTSFASEVKDLIETDFIPSAVFGGYINEISLNIALQPNNHDKLYAELSNPYPKKVTSHSLTAQIDSGRIEILAAYESKNIAQRLKKAGVPSDKGYYFIADKIIWAKQISYFIGPGLIKGNPYSRNASDRIDSDLIANAKSNGATIADVNGVKVITQKFGTERAVAVGYSVLPNLTKMGDSKIKIGSQPIMADTFAVHSTPVKFIK